MKVTNSPVTLPMTGTLVSPAQLNQMTQAAEQEFPYDPLLGNAKASLWTPG